MRQEVRAAAVPPRKAAGHREQYAYILIRDAGAVPHGLTTNIVNSSCYVS